MTFGSACRWCARARSSEAPTPARRPSSRPRITNNCEDDLPFTLQRRQFPLELAFAMTINESQGQALRNVVLYLPFPVFAHGQLYTAFSRVSDPSSIKALIRDGKRADGHTYTSNTVYRQVTCDDWGS